jgi:PIN domain nuclease of toxin-antitoxin system
MRSRFHYVISQLEYRDPPDRILITTAVELACRLATYDERTLRFVADYGRQYGFAARA